MTMNVLDFGLTAWQVASLPFWALALFFVVKLFRPAPEFRARNKLGVHIACSLIACGVFAYMAARLWS